MIPFDKVNYCSFVTFKYWHDHFLVKGQDCIGHTKYGEGNQILMICIPDLANQGIENYLSGKIKIDHSDGSAIYLSFNSLHIRYIPYVYPKYCNYKGGNFP